VQGGKVFGDWPGLADEQLYEDRDLNLTTDFRDVLGEPVARHLGNPNLKTMFPGYENPKFRGAAGLNAGTETARATFVTDLPVSVPSSSLEPSSRPDRA
jgi:uncharacterized protein (DUF1501 family)